MVAKLTSFVAGTLKKRYGDRAVGRGDVVARPNRRIISPSLELNYAHGGGLPLGRITLYYGSVSGGKTTTAKLWCGLAQKLCRNCLWPAKNVVAVPPSAADLAEDPEARWGAIGECDCFATGAYAPPEPEIDALMAGGFIEGDKKPNKNSKKHKEGLETWRECMMANSYEEFVAVWIDMEDAYDFAWAETMGVDNRRMLYVRPENAEEAIDIWAALILTGHVDFVVVDSIAHLVPQAEILSSMEDWQQGLQARLTNKAIRKVVSGSSTVANQRRSVTQIWTNQTRTNIGMRFGDPTVKPGGAGQGFAAHVEMRFTKVKIETISETWGSASDGEIDQYPIESTMVYRVTKNRTAPLHGVNGSYTIALRDTDTYPAGTILEEASIYKRTMHHLVEQKKNKGKTSYHLAGEEFPTQASVKEALRENDALREAVKSQLLDIMLTGRGKG